jgi:hypothetical protein
MEKNIDVRLKMSYTVFREVLEKQCSQAENSAPRAVGFRTPRPSN